MTERAAPGAEGQPPARVDRVLSATLDGSTVLWDPFTRTTHVLNATA
jgi:hypothetical protein